MQIPSSPRRTYRTDRTWSEGERADPHQPRPGHRCRGRAARRHAHRQGPGDGPRGGHGPGRGGPQRAAARLQDHGLRQVQVRAEEADAKQKTHQLKVKEIRVRPKTGDHDIEIKVKQARKFLEHKDKVLVNVLFRGREMAHIEEGRRVMDEVLQALEDVAKVEKNPSMEGRRMTAIVAPAT